MEKYDSLQHLIRTTAVAELKQQTSQKMILLRSALPNVLQNNHLL